MTIEELHNKYKYLFEQDEDGKILRGIECGEGWLNHVEVLLDTFQWHTIHNKKDDIDNDIKIFQIKEKFGQARVYFSSNNPNITDMLYEAVGRLEGKCEITCESCGKLEYDCIKTGKNGWIRCICNDCTTKNNLV